EAAFEQPFDQRATRHFDGYCHALRLAHCHGPQPVRQAGQTGTIMVNGPFPPPATVAGEHTDLMLLGTPINPYKPLVWHRLIISLGRHSGRYSKTHNSLSSLSRVFLSLMISRGCHSALYGCLRHNFLPEVAHGSLARVHVLCWHSGCRALGVLRARGSPRSHSIVFYLDSSLMVQGS